MAYNESSEKIDWIADPVSEPIGVYGLRDGRFASGHACAVFPEWEWARMNEEDGRRFLEDI